MPIAVPLALIAAGATVAGGVSAANAQKRSLRQQQFGEAAALAAAKRTRDQNAQDIAAANRKKPDIAQILARAQLDMGKLPSTMLTGPSGLPSGGLLGQ